MYCARARDLRPVRFLALCALATASLAASGCGTKMRGTPPAPAVMHTGDGAQYLAHEIVVRMAPEISAATFQNALSMIGGKVIVEAGGLGELGFRRIQLPVSTTADLAISQLISAGAVARAERNFLVQAWATPNDTRYAELWGMAKIGAPSAWDTTTGSTDVLVAISDTGVDYTHPELAANMWTNTAEIPGNGKDDDNNGYVDDVYGYDFANSDGNPMDDHGHGTHVGGTIGGAGNNGNGVAGVNWRVKIQAVKFLAANGGGSTWGGAQTILYAAKMKARVVNASWGCQGAGCYASYLEDALRTLEAAGGLFVAAAGNAASNNDSSPAYPANYAVNNVVTVAATDSADKLASFSNYGATKVHIGAPGVAILSSTPGNSYASWNGTSMAAPHVAGAAALFLAVRPDATVSEVKQKLLATVDPIAALAGKTTTGGRLNLARLINTAGKQPAAPAGFQAVPGDRSDVLLSWNANTEIDLAGYRVRWGTAAGIYNQTRNLTKTETETRVTDLFHGTNYYFVVHALTTNGLLSVASPEKMVTPGDHIAPPQVVDLTASTVSGAEAAGQVLTASGDFSSFWAAANAFDGSADTAWISPGRHQLEEESLTVGLTTPYLINAVELLPNAAYPAFFPVDFDIEVSVDGESWDAVGGLRDATASAGDRVRIAFAPTLAAAVRLRVIRPFAHESGLYYTSIAELVVHEASSAPQALGLTFTAPGDDPGEGRSASYDVRRSTAPITDANFAAATAIPSVQPLATGVREALTVSPLAGETTYYFAMKATDEGGNVSPLSNVASATTLVVPPSTITDLRAVEVAGVTSPGTVTLAWTAPGSDGKSGQASAYELRYALSPMTSGDFAGATPVVGVQAPAVAGTAETFVLTGLTVGQTYYFALRAVDGSGARGGVSNIIWVIPTSGNDLTPPAAVGDLSVHLLSPALAADLSWVAPGDDGYAGTAAAYDLRMATAPITEANFAAADVVATMQPLHGGLIEVLHLASVPSEKTLYFALKAVDSDGNWSALSNVAVVATPGIPPAAITNLAATGATAAAVTLSFTATGDDGNTGTASSYELRYAAAPLTAETWAAAMTAPTPAPQAAGTQETIIVAGLASATTYYFGIKAIDDVGKPSPLSNIVSRTTLDGTPPAAIADLLAAPVDAAARPPLTITASDSSGSYSPETAAKNLIDATASTVWISPGTTQVTPMFVTFELGGARRLGKLRMRAGQGYTDLFPADFRVEVQAQTGGTWKSVVTETAFVSAGGWEEWTLGAVNALAVRLTVTKTSPWNGKLYTALGDFELYEDPADYSTLRLSWTAPGDDGSNGTATGYDLRRAGAAISEGTFPAATVVSGVPAPHAAGYLERFDVTGLTAETTYCFALKTADEKANSSGVSNSSCATTPGQPPGTITDLVVSGVGPKTATLTFTAPGADGAQGTASRYEMRWSKSRINSLNWDAATAVDPLPTPGAAGAAQTATVSGLTGLTTYYFAVRAVDGAGNIGALSNNAVGTTADDVAPARVTNLTAATNAAQGGSLLLTWTAPGDNGMGGTAKQYDVRVSTQLIDDSNFGAATPVTVGAPKAGGQAESATLTGLSAETLYFVALRTTDTAGNVSAVSNAPSARTRDEAPAAITNLAIVGGTGRTLGNATLVIQWSAPGDDATVGSAQSYELRYATAAITAANFASATLSQGPAPAAAGTVQQHTLGGLAVGVKYFVAMKAIDDRGNVSALSNVPNGTTPDELAPARSTDLSATTGVSAGSLTVSVTAPGDDDLVGIAKSYELRWSLNPLDATSFASAAVLTTPAPAAAGVRQSFTVTGLPNESTIYLMLLARDDSGNASPLSNVASANTPDVAPSPVTDLRQLSQGTGTVTLGWTATGDDAKVGTAVEYDLRYATTTITDQTFAAATRASISAPRGAGWAESAVISGLLANKTYSFAIKARDDRGTWSTLSNVLGSATQDTLAPGAITNLAATTGATAGTIKLTWTATGDDATTGTANKYELRRSTSPLTAANFAAATAVTVPAPKVAGVAETFVVTGLTGETTHHFMLRAVDEAGNNGDLSNSTSADTAPVAPAAVTDLVAKLSVVSSAASVTLTWTAPGDDDKVGKAVSYDIRFSKTAISAANFGAATAVTAPATATAGTVQTAVVSGLAQSSTYYFALKAVDDTQTWSGLSNVPSVTTPDLTKPGAPTSLNVGVPDNQGKRMAPTKVTTSSLLGPSWEATNLGDSDPSSAWASAGSDVEAAESATIDLGAAVAIDRIVLTPDAKYLGLFPRDFTLAVSTDNSKWTTVATEVGFTVDAAAALTWGFPAESARYVRLATTRTGTSFDRHYAIVADFDVYSAAAADGQAQLTWVAPGDDDATGTATRYEIFRHTQAFNEAQLASVTPVTGAPVPVAGGLLQTLTVPALHGETTYYWALRAVDEAGNVGPLSAVVSGKTNNVSPAAVRTLTGTALSTTAIRLDWKASGDDGMTGVVASYEIRYLAGAISSQNFGGATLVPGLPAPAAAGAAQTVTVSGLGVGVDYHFALVSKDAAGNTSHLSDVAAVSTQRLPDVTPPATVSDLTVTLPPAGGQLVTGKVTAKSSEQAPDFKATNAGDGSRNTIWASGPRASSQEEWVRVEVPANTPSDRVRIWPADAFTGLFPPDFQVRTSPDGLAWTTVGTVINYVATAGQPALVTFPTRTLRFVELRVTRLAQHSGGLYYAAVSELEVLTASEPPGTVVASWTSPSDDGATGRAASYNLRVGACPLQTATATAAPTTAPAAAGTPERTRIGGLASGQYCVAVASADSAGNNSAFSNVATVTVP